MYFTKQRVIPFNGASTSRVPRVQKFVNSLIALQKGNFVMLFSLQAFYFTY